MRLGTLDIAVLIVYFAAMITLGFYLKRRASKNLESYFLGDRQLPWWLLGISNASAMWDITGTMWLVTVLFVYGMKAVFLPWMWPTFNQVFDAVYVSKWIRRSNARTGAEWIVTRFGSGRGGELSRAIIVLFALISVVAFIGYEFQGIGKFCKGFLPWDLSPSTYAIVLMSITAIYVVLGGMFSVVLTDFVQFCLMAVSAVVIGAIAIVKVSPEMIAQATPAGWSNLFFGWTINLDWSMLPAMKDKIADDGYAAMFGLFFTVMVCKGILVSMAGAAPNYDMQRILASKTPREASLMSAIVSLCLVPRWILIGGITLLGLVFLTPKFQTMGAKIDFELVFPYVINNFLPAGLIGVLLAGLMSSFMANFSATVNAGAAYLVNDVYKRFINPEADNRKVVRASYLASVLILLAGMAIGFSIPSIDKITQWITAGLFGGYAAANVLKWYWWRLNGKGYFGGMLVGIVTAASVPTLKQIPALNVNDIYYFPFILGLSAITSIVVSLMSEPVEDETLKNFYLHVRPWGFWGPVHAMVARDNPAIERNTEAPRDFLNIAVGIAWQLMLVTVPLYVLLRDLRGTLISVAVLVCAMIFLKKFWYDNLEKGEGLSQGTSSTKAAPESTEAAGG